MWYVLTLTFDGASVEAESARPVPPPAPRPLLLSSDMLQVYILLVMFNVA